MQGSHGRIRTSSSPPQTPYKMQQVVPLSCRSSPRSVVAGVMFAAKSFLPACAGPQLWVSPVCVPRPAHFAPHAKWLPNKSWMRAEMKKPLSTASQFAV